MFSFISEESHANYLSVNRLRQVDNFHIKSKWEWAEVSKVIVGGIVFYRISKFLFCFDFTGDHSPKSTWTHACPVFLLQFCIPGININKTIETIYVFNKLGRIIWFAKQWLPVEGSKEIPCFNVKSVKRGVMKQTSNCSGF